MKKATYVFCGGGTGGHIYPGIAVAESLHSVCEKLGSQVDIDWIGHGGKAMDGRLLSKYTGGTIRRFYGIPAGKLRRYFSFMNFVDVFKIMAGFVASVVLLIKIKPIAVFSKGGFVSVPVVVAAHFLRVAVFTHECDFTPGLATRINAKFATKVLLSYNETKAYFSQSMQKKLAVTGNPVRDIFYEADALRGLTFLGLCGNNTGGGADNFAKKGDVSENDGAVLQDKSVASESQSDISSTQPPDSQKNIVKNKGKPILLVLGGSLGAQQINNMVSENLDWLLERFIVVHQTGKVNACSGAEVVSKNGYYPYDFIYGEMADVEAACDIVLGRAGASTIWEAAILGKPMVLIPLCGSGTRGDQVDNARYFQKNGAALSLVGDDATSNNLQDSLTKMLDPATLQYAKAQLSTLVGKARASNRIALVLSQALQ